MNIEAVGSILAGHFNPMQLDIFFPSKLVSSIERSFSSGYSCGLPNFPSTCERLLISSDSVNLPEVEIVMDRIFEFASSKKWMLAEICDSSSVFSQISRFDTIQSPVLFFLSNDSARIDNSFLCKTIEFLKIRSGVILLAKPDITEVQIYETVIAACTRCVILQMKETDERIFYLLNHPLPIPLLSFDWPARYSEFSGNRKLLETGKAVPLQLLNWSSVLENPESGRTDCCPITPQLSFGF